MKALVKSHLELGALQSPVFAVELDALRRREDYPGLSFSPQKDVTSMRRRRPSDAAIVNPRAES